MDRQNFNNIRKSFKEKLPESCQNCDSEEDLHLHHIVPLSIGGANKASNIAVLCANCHTLVHHGDKRLEMSHLSQSARRTKAEAGKWSAGKVPYGYKVENGELVIEEIEAELVKFVFESRYLKGYSYTQIRNGMKENNLKTRRGKDELSNSRINWMLNNPLYVGEYFFEGNLIGYLDDNKLILSKDLIKIIKESK